MAQPFYLVAKYLLQIRRQNLKSGSIRLKPDRPILHALGAAWRGGGAEPADAGGHGDGGLQGHHRVDAAMVALYPEERAARYALYVAAAVYGAVDVYHIINILR